MLHPYTLLPYANCYKMDLQKNQEMFLFVVNCKLSQGIGNLCLTHFSNCKVTNNTNKEDLSKRKKLLFFWAKLQLKLLISRIVRQQVRIGPSQDLDGTGFWKNCLGSSVWNCSHPLLSNLGRRQITVTRQGFVEVSDLSILTKSFGDKICPSMSLACWTKSAYKLNCLHSPSVGQLSKTTDNCHQAGFGAFKAIHTIHKFSCQKLSVNKSGWKNHQLLSKIACRHRRRTATE